MDGVVISRRLLESIGGVTGTVGNTRLPLGAAEASAWDGTQFSWVSALSFLR